MRANDRSAAGNDNTTRGTMTSTAIDGPDDYRSAERAHFRSNEQNEATESRARLINNASSPSRGVGREAVTSNSRLI